MYYINRPRFYLYYQVHSEEYHGLLILYRTAHKKNSETNIERNLAWIKIVDNQVQCIYLAQNLLFDEFHFTQ